MVAVDVDAQQFGNLVMERASLRTFHDFERWGERHNTMEITILICLIFAILFLITDIKNKYHLLFSGMLLGVTLSLVTTFLMTAKGGNYTFAFMDSYFTGHTLRFWLYSFYGSLFRNASWNQLVTFRNMGMSLFFVCLFCFVRSFYRSTFLKKDSDKKRIRISGLLMIAYPAMYYIFYHPDTAFHIYIFYHRARYQSISAAQNFALFVRGVDYLFIMFGVLYLLYPLYYLFLKGIKKEISFFAEQFIGLGISLGLFNIMIMNTLLFHSLKLSVQEVFSAGYWGISLTGQLSSFYNVILPAVIFIVLSMAFYFALMFGINSVIGGWREHIIRKNLNKMYLNLRDVFHTDKNLFFSVQKLSELSINKYGTEEGLEALRKIKEISDVQMNTLTRNLNNIKKINIKNSSTDLIDILEKALKEIEGMSGLQITRDYPKTPVYCFLDAYHLMNVFTNILHNSVDAIKRKGEEEGRIHICLKPSNDWIFCSITDNGCGVEKKAIKRKILFSQQKTVRPNHYGMGLPYIYQIIQAHGGHIKFHSKINFFTTVEILLPQARSKN